MIRFPPPPAERRGPASPSGRSLTESPRRSPAAPSRSANSVGRTIVRRTQSSRSQTSSGVSDTIPPFGHKRRNLLCERDVSPEDPVAEQAEAAQVRKTRALRKAREQRNVQRWVHTGDREIDVDVPF